MLENKYNVVWSVETTQGRRGDDVPSVVRYTSSILEFDEGLSIENRRAPVESHVDTSVMIVINESQEKSSLVLDS